MILLFLWLDIIFVYSNSLKKNKVDFQDITNIEEINKKN